MKKISWLAMFITIFGSISLPLHSSSKIYHADKKMLKNFELPGKLQKLFENSKVVCFGRYAIRVPREAVLIFGDASFPSTISVLEGGAELHSQLADEAISNIMQHDSTAIITRNSKGPLEGAWQITYYESEIEKRYKLHMFRTFLSLGSETFILRGSVRKGESQEVTEAREISRMRNLRLRKIDDVPSEPGYCIDRGFIISNDYSDQEMVSVGFHLPSFPDVSFSIHSNKNAYSDYPVAEFQKMKREELPLLERIRQAKEAQGSSYPSRKVLREGKRNVQHWAGEESLFTRMDGTHDFEWAFVGTPKDVANPSEYNARMFTKVAHNTVGAAEKASLTDEEAVALWDKLLSGLKFRVKVPGAPECSYYFLPGEKTSSGAKP